MDLPRFCDQHEPTTARSSNVVSPFCPKRGPSSEGVRLESRAPRDSARLKYDHRPESTRLDHKTALNAAERVRLAVINIQEVVSTRKHLGESTTRSVIDDYTAPDLEYRPCVRVQEPDAHSRPLDTLHSTWLERLAELRREGSRRCGGDGSCCCGDGGTHCSLVLLVGVFHADPERFVGREQLSKTNGRSTLDHKRLLEEVTISHRRRRRVVADYDAAREVTARKACCDMHRVWGRYNVIFPCYHGNREW